MLTQPRKSQHRHAQATWNTSPCALRVHAQVLEPANTHVYRDMTLEQYLQKHKYSKPFTYNYVVPMCAAVWSVPNAQVSRTSMLAVTAMFLALLSPLPSVAP